MDYAIYLLDLDGNVKSWNVGAQRIKGYSEEEIIATSAASSRRTISAPARYAVLDATEADVDDIKAFVAEILSDQRRIAKLLKTATAHQRALKAQLRNEITKRHQAEKLVRRASSHDS